MELALQNNKIDTQKENKISFDIKILPLILFILNVALCGFVPQTLSAIVSVVLLCVLVFTPYYYLACPVVIFYYSQLGMFYIVSVFRIYTLLFFVSLILDRAKFKKITLDTIIPLVILVIYSLVMITSVEIKECLFCILDIIFVAIFISSRLNSLQSLKRFFTVYNIVMVTGFIYGLIFQNSVDTQMKINGAAQEIFRFSGTFEDPNYMGFFYMIGIFGMICLQLYNLPVRIILTIAFYVMVMFGMSVTLIVTSIIIWPVYIIVTRQVKLKIIILVALIVALLILAYNIALNYPDSNLGTYAYRIKDKLFALDSGDISDVTTGRSDLTKEHFDYFVSQSSILQVLFGGNIINTRAQITFSGAAHNEYVDMLLNIGIVGTILMIGCLLIKFVKGVSNYRKNNDRVALLQCMSKIIWITYAMTLTMFLDFRFLMFFLI